MPVFFSVYVYMTVTPTVTAVVGDAPFVRESAGVCVSVTNVLAELDVWLPPVADAVFVIEPRFRSAWVTIYVPVQEVVPPAASGLVAPEQSTVATLLSVTVKGPLIDEVLLLCRVYV